MLTGLVRFRRMSARSLSVDGGGSGIEFALLCQAPSALSPEQVKTMNSIMDGAEATRYCLILSQDSDRLEVNNTLSSLPARCYVLPRGWQIQSWPGHPVVQFANLYSAIFTRTVRIAQALTEACPRIVIAGTDDMLDLIAACLAARLTALRFVPCLFDDCPSELPQGALRNKVDSLLRSVVFHKTDRVIVPNEVLRNKIEQRYHVAATVIQSRTDEIPGNKEAADRAGLNSFLTIIRSPVKRS